MEITIVREDGRMKAFILPEHQAGLEGFLRRAEEEAGNVETHRLNGATGHHFYDGRWVPSLSLPLGPAEKAVGGHGPDAHDELREELAAHHRLRWLGKAPAIVEDQLLIFLNEDEELDPIDVPRHVEWEHDGERGRLAYIVKADRFHVKQIGGCAPPAAALGEIIRREPELRERANEAHSQRVKPWGVEIRSGMSGCEDFLLRVEEAPELWDYPIVAGLHISMYGKLNEGVSLYVGDLPPILQAVDANATADLEVGRWGPVPAEDRSHMVSTDRGPLLEADFGVCRTSDVDLFGVEFPGFDAQGNPLRDSQRLEEGRCEVCGDDVPEGEQNPQYVVCDECTRATCQGNAIVSIYSEEPPRMNF